jgi:hypothetical protein
MGMNNAVASLTAIIPEHVTEMAVNLNYFVVLVKRSFFGHGRLTPSLCGDVS